ncbi:MAG: BBP7 family outer membrane beta-barrel protein [Planctomycetota bacterium]
MKFLWQLWLMISAVAVMISGTNAQQIGSYQSILANAGYGNNSYSPMTYGNQQAGMIPSPPGFPTAAPMPNTGYPSTGMGAMVAQPQGYAPMVPNQMGASAMMGGPMNQGMMHNQGMQQPMMNPSPQPTMAAPAKVSGPMSNIPGPQPAMAPVQGCATGNCGGGAQFNGATINQGNAYGGGGCAPTAAPTYLDYGAAGYNAAPVYTPAVNFAPAVATAAANRNLVGSFFFANFRRNYEDRKRLVNDWTGATVYSTDVQHGGMTALGYALTSRSCNGSGFELRYWGLEEDDSYDVTGPTTSGMPSFSGLYHDPSATDIFTIYNTGDSARLIRGTEIQNFEANLLRNGGCYQTRFGQCASFELLGGFRFIRFNDDFRLLNFSSVAGYPTTLDYNLEANNSLAGLQLGGRSEVCLTQRLRLNYGATVGLFNNHVETRQRMTDELGRYATLGTGGGRDLDYTATKNDAAILGQFDLGLSMQLTCNFRVRGGYQAFGLSGVALAVDQIPHTFTYPSDLNRSQTNGSLLLHGFTLGGELCF